MATPLKMIMRTLSNRLPYPVLSNNIITSVARPALCLFDYSSTLSGTVQRVQLTRGFSATTQSASQQASVDESEGIVISSSAVQRLKELAKERGQGLFLRVEVEGGGCSGFQYKFALDSKTGPTDVVFEKEGSKVVTDTVSLEFLKGAKVEYEDSLMRSAFVIAANPNSEASCGCGSSFTAKMN